MKEINEKIEAMYQNGMSIQKISKIVKIPRETLRIRLIKNGIKLRKSKKELGIKYHKPLYEINAESAELLAMHAGDGSLSKDKRWCFSSNKNDRKLIERVINLTKKIVGVSSDVDYYENRVQIRSKQRQAIEYFSTFFPIGKKSHIVRLPLEIENSSNLEVIKGALIGLFSTDGSFSFRKNNLSSRVEFRVKSRKLRDQFYNLALKIGFNFNISEPKHKEGVIYTAYIERTNDVLKWMEEIGSNCDTHLNRFNEWLKLKSAGVG